MKKFYTADLCTDLDTRSIAMMRLILPDWYTKIYKVKVDYDWLTWKYKIIRWSRDVELQWTDFDKEWRAKCFMKYILTKDCRDVIKQRPLD